MYDKFVDNLIVGAGPAGCVAAYILHSNKQKCLLLEIKNLQTKEKLCGGILSSDVYPLLSEVYGTNYQMPVAQAISKNVVLNEYGAQKEMPFRVYTTLRKAFDDDLVKRFQAVGGEIQDCMQVQSIDVISHSVQVLNLRTKEKMVVHYKRLIAADGADSSIRYLITGERPRTILALEGNVCEQEVQNSIIMQPNRLFLGYAWYIPQGKVANVGVAYFNNKYLITKELLQDCLENFVQSIGKKYTNLKGAFIPCGDDVLLQMGDVYFLGDAAGLIDPITGGGVHIAVESAICLAKALFLGDSYDSQCKALIEKQSFRMKNIADAYNKLSL